MQQYKVVALYLSGRGKKIFRSGDIITAADLVDGETEAEKRVAGGFIEKYDALSLPELEEAVLLPNEETEATNVVEENTEVVVPPAENQDNTAEGEKAPAAENQDNTTPPAADAAKKGNKKNGR
jgi:hypothetical protein